MICHVESCGNEAIWQGDWGTAHVHYCTPCLDYHRPSMKNITSYPSLTKEDFFKELG